MAEVKDRADSVTEFEYQTPCCREECDDPAVVFTSQSHSSDGTCWSRGQFRCQTHYEMKRDEMAAWLKVARRCNNCGEPVSGTLEQNMRVIPL